MKFGSFPVEETVGAILAHSLRLDDATRLRKGTRLTSADVERLRHCGIKTVTVAKPEVGDVLEDEAAFQVADRFNHASLRHDEATTGRVNFFAKTNGLLCVNKRAIDRLNAVDPGITLATLENHQEVNAGRMVATVKIIPYMVEAAQLEKVNALDLANAIRVQPFSAFKVGLVQSALPDTKTSVLDKTRRMLARRLELSGSLIVAEKRVAHTQEAFAAAISELGETCDMVILFGASAISDTRDVIPAAIEEKGGRIVRFGMPVDPGNLLLIA
ncbi:MAG: molybdopterin-binding protein, partial [Pseudomonadota bacterium]